MDPIFEFQDRTRRQFLTTAASGLGGVALASLQHREGLSQTLAKRSFNPLAERPSHFAPRAKACIFIYMAGGPSQVDLFDPKPVLNQRDGKKMPDSLLKDVEFAFVKKDEAVLKGSAAKFRPRGQCGVEYSDMIPQIGSCADDIALIRTVHGEQFNHHPGQLLLSCGKAELGRPTIGSWLLYGLGSETENLPGYVVLTAGRGASGGSSNWSSGFLPSTYQGVSFRDSGDPVLFLSNPPGIQRNNQRRTLDAISKLNELRHNQMRDMEIASRTAQYELAFRMQSAAPELTDLSGESAATLDSYGIGRKTPRPTADMQSGETYHRFSANCLLARRLVERGVRFINIVHASWDQHGNLKHDLAWNCRMADQPIAALLRDLKQRGMLDDTLVIWGSEFGRTPLGQGGDGRDHHPFAFSMWMAGGGAKGGTVYGQTDEIGWAPVHNPVHVNDFQATLLHLFGLDHRRLSINHRGLQVRLTNLAGHVIHDVIA
ncbi:MAG TPA: DUF1501 domain-containing protein [Planctomycetes bacterium]|nr:DUF1501 domain-containing protein [Planctomycetaceae bacterium]HIM29926.1 DUF1501 domain-containing protein [Planctomycetota bacterium]